MSTKGTIAHGEDYHLYQECFESGSLYLELRMDDIYFEAYPNSVTVRIPNEILKAILDNSDKIKQSFEYDSEFVETTEPWVKSGGNDENR